MEPLQSNWFFPTLRKTGFLTRFFFCNLLVKDYIKIGESVPGNWDFTCCLVSTDVSRFDFVFFKLHYWLMWKTTQKQIRCFCASTQYCHNISLLIADLIKKTYNSHSRTWTKVLRNVGRYEDKVLWSSPSQDIMLWSLTSSSKSSSSERKGGVLRSKSKNQLKRFDVAKPFKCVMLDSW